MCSGTSDSTLVPDNMQGNPDSTKEEVVSKRNILEMHKLLQVDLHQYKYMKIIL